MADYTLFPSVLPDGEEFVDNQYSREELERKSWDELRSLAAEHETEEVNGRSDREEIEEALTGKERV